MQHARRPANVVATLKCLESQQMVCLVLILPNPEHNFQPNAAASKSRGQRPHEKRSAIYLRRKYLKQTNRSRSLLGRRQALRRAFPTFDTPRCVRWPFSPVERLLLIVGHSRLLKGYCSLLGHVSLPKLLPNISPENPHINFSKGRNS